MIVQTKDDDIKFMMIALAEAEKALHLGNPPVGSILLVGNEIIAKAHNSNSSDRSWLAHAEQKALHAAASELRYAGEVSEEPVKLYTTLQPCLMCFFSAIHSRVSTIVYGLEDEVCGFCQIREGELTPWYRARFPVVRGGVARSSCLDLFNRYVAVPPFGVSERNR